MRAALSIAALAAGALAIPYKRELLTDVQVVYVTDVVTVTAGQAAPSAPAKVQHHGHKHPLTTVIEQVSQVAPTSQAPPPPPPTVTQEAIQQAPAQAPAPSFPKVPLAVPSAPASIPTSYQDIVVTHHNMHRRNHSVADIEWDEGLASAAATIASSCVYSHNTDVAGGGYGQNIAAGIEGDKVGDVITDLFYNGEEPYFAPNYGASSPDMSGFEKWGHFTQIVWKATTHVGCATQYCPGGLANAGSGVSPYFTVCNYKNPGNYDGEYGANVLAPQGMPTANGNTNSL